MSSSPLQPIVSAVALTTDWQDLYQVPETKIGVGIDAVVMNNYSSATAMFSVRLVQSGTATELNEVITDEDVRAFDNNLAPAMIGQALLSGGIIQAKASANNSISANITGTIIDS